MGKYYIMQDGIVVEVDDILTWGRYFNTADRTIARTQIGDALVSTVFLGLNHRFGPGSPLLFETMVFGGELEGETERYETIDEARIGHEQMVNRVSSGLTPLRADAEHGQAIDDEQAAPLKLDC